MKRFFSSSIFSVVLLAVFFCCACGNHHEVPNASVVPVDSAELPFPKFSFQRTDTALIPGYFFIAPFRTDKNAQKKSGSLMILNTQGAIEWIMPNVEGSNFQMHENGTMSFFRGDKFFLMNKDFSVFDSVSCVNGTETDAHEFLRMPNGHFLLIGIRKDTEDLSAIHLEKPVKWQGSKQSVVKYGVIQELDEHKQLVWEWNAKGHFAIDDFDPVYFTDGSKMDIPHFNAIDIDSSGNLLLTARYSNEVVYLNRQSGNIEWRFGGKHSDFKIADSSLFLGQHAARFLPNGNILLFDNGYSYEGNTHNACGVEYKLDRTSMSATKVWSWSHPENLVSESTGNTQQLPRGRTLINFGKVLNRSPNIMFVVVDSRNTPEITCSFNDTMGTYRTYYYQHLSFSLDTPRIICSWENGHRKVTSEDGSVVWWSNGLKAQAIYADQPGLYQWFRPNADGSYTGSDAYVVTPEMLKEPKRDSE